MNPASHEPSDPDHEAQEQSDGPSNGGTWALVDQESVSSANSSATPHVSLFSPGVPAVQPSTSRVHMSSFSSLGSSRSMPSLANIASMTKRIPRFKVSDEHTPIVQLHAGIDQAQKSGDDPTTPLEGSSRKRTTIDLMTSEQVTRTDIGSLFSDSIGTPGSRAPSYSNATGPLYMRGEATCASVWQRVHTDETQHQTKRSPYLTISTRVVCSKAAIQTLLSPPLANDTISIVSFLIVLPSSLLHCLSRGLKARPRK